MSSGSPKYGRWFDAALALPLVAYLAILVLLVGSLLLRVTPAAVIEAFDDPALLHAVWLSIWSTMVSTALSLFVAVPAGYVLSRNRFPGYSLVDTLLDVPIVLPPLVMGLCVLIFFRTGLGQYLDRQLMLDLSELLHYEFARPGDGLFVFERPGIILVQFVVGCAFAVRVVKAGFDELDPRHEDVALTLGATRSQAFFAVVVPNIMPSFVAGAVISWARIFGLFGPIILVAGTMRNHTEVMPTTIFLETSIGRLDVALVVGAFMIIISMTMLALFKRLGGKGYLW
jgi:molybdate transport system permease protein